MASAIDINHDAVRIINRIHQLIAAREKVVAAMKHLNTAQEWQAPGPPSSDVLITSGRAFGLLKLDILAIDKKIHFEYGRYVAKREQVPDDATVPVSDAPS